MKFSQPCLQQRSNKIVKEKPAQRQIQLQQLLLHNRCSGQHNVPVSF
jgi:hypothetical protein